MRALLPLLLLALPLEGCAATGRAPAAPPVQWCGDFPCRFELSEFCRSPEGARAQVCKSSYAGAISRRPGDRVYQSTRLGTWGDMARQILYVPADGSATIEWPGQGSARAVPPAAVARFERVLEEIGFETAPIYAEGQDTPGIVRMCFDSTEFTLVRNTDAGFKALVRDCHDVDRAIAAWNAMVEVGRAAGLK